jgi:hypothetical protein
MKIGGEFKEYAFSLTIKIVNVIIFLETAARVQWKLWLQEII